MTRRSHAALVDELIWTLEQQKNEEEKKNCLYSMLHAIKTKCGTEVLENAILSVLHTANPSAFSKLKNVCGQHKSPFSTYSWYMRSDVKQEKDMKQIRTCFEQLKELARQDAIKDEDEVYFLDEPGKTFGKEEEGNKK
jgi:hypothetical protein